MAGTYTRRFGWAAVTGPGESLVFTATPDHVWILRDLVVTNHANAAQFIQVYIRSGTNVFNLVTEQTFPAVKSIHVELRQEIRSGESLFVYGATAQASCIATGYALAL